MGFLQGGGQDGGGDASATASAPGPSVGGQIPPQQSFGQSMQQRYPIAGGLAQMVFGGQNNAMPNPELLGQAQMPQSQQQGQAPQGQSYIPPALHDNPIFKLIAGI